MDSPPPPLLLVPPSELAVFVVTACCCFSAGLAFHWFVQTLSRRHVQQALEAMGHASWPDPEAPVRTMEAEQVYLAPNIGDVERGHAAAMCGDVDDEDLSEGFDAEQVVATTARLRQVSEQRRESAAYLNLVQQALARQQHEHENRHPVLNGVRPRAPAQEASSLRVKAQAHLQRQRDAQAAALASKMKSP